MKLGARCGAVDICCTVDLAHVTNRDYTDVERGAKSQSGLKSNQIKSKLLVLGADKTTINDQGCQHVTGRCESIRMFLSKRTGWPTFVQSHPSVKTVQ